MTEMISVREAAVRWNITERRVATLCKNGRIAGAKKQDNRWLIPTDTQKPADQRLKTLNMDMLQHYNTVRIHSHCGYESPDQYEADFGNVCLRNHRDW